MKYIRKTTPPSELRKWFKKQVVDGKRINSHYRNIPSQVKRVIEEHLLSEQGWLCCYTGMLLIDGNFHVEHVIPQSVSKIQGTYEDVDYNNMLAAYPRGDSSYGAKVRGDKPLLITPLQKNCGENFDFDFDGRISGKNKNAIQTINTLKLDSPLLDEMRYQAIEEALSPNNKPRSEAQLKIIADQFCTVNKNGRYPKFCFVVSQIARKKLDRIERERKRRSAILRNKKK